MPRTPLPAITLTPTPDADNARTASRQTPFNRPITPSPGDDVSAGVVPARGSWTASSSMPAHPTWWNDVPGRVPAANRSEHAPMRHLSRKGAAEGWGSKTPLTLVPVDPTADGEHRASDLTASELATTGCPTDRRPQLTDHQLGIRGRRAGKHDDGFRSGLPVHSQVGTVGSNGSWQARTSAITSRIGRPLERA